jgi:beta-lactamase regulating signal transducer with metallopeptidase domain
MFAEIVDGLNHAGAVFVAGLINTAVIVAIGAVVAILVARRKGWSAATRCCLWWISLAFVTLMPVLSCLPLGLQTQTLGHAMTGAGPISPVLPAVAPIGPQQFPSASDLPSAAARLSGAAAFLLCWLAAAGIQAIRLVWSLLCGLRLKRMSEAAGPDLESHFRQLCARVRTRRAVRLSVSTQISSPAVVGYLRPHVIVPVGLACRLTSEEAEQVILHELAHVARYDDLFIAIQRILEAIAAFHPVIRYIGHRLDLDREMACDDYVASIHESKRYAACLAKVAEIRSMPAVRIMSVSFLDRESELLTRVRVLLDKTRTHVPRISGRRLALVSAACIAFGVIGLQAPRLLALPMPASASASGQVSSSSAQAPKVPARGQGAGITSILVTTPDGHRSEFGEMRGMNFGRAHGEPAAIEFTAHGKRYLIRDKGILARAQAILKPSEKLGQRQQALGEQQSRLGAEQAKYGERQRNVSEKQLDASTREQLSQKLGELKAKLDELNSKKLAETASEAQAQLGELQADLAKMQAQMGSVQARAGKEQTQLGAEQAKLGSQQAKLGKQQAALGAQQAAQAKRAEKQLKELIRSAESQGLAEKLQ